jgi:starch-binding outer membrane protein, SusD/RagB family
MKYPKFAVMIILLLFFAVGCELEVANLNQPERDRVLSTGGDVISLIGGSFNSLYYALADIDGIGPIISVNSFQHSAYPANFGMVEYSWIPRPAINNTPAHGFAMHFELTWYRAYRAISAASDGILQLDAQRFPIAADVETAARAFAKFIQGVSHGYLAILYDQAFIFDETLDPEVVYDLVPASEVFAAAAGYLNDAITIGTANAAVAVPAGWTGLQVENLGELARLARTYRAYFRANMPRTPGEVNNVDWAAVVSDIDNGRTRDFAPVAPATGSEWYSWNLVYMNFPGWSQLNYFIKGMADQSGNYQTWYNLPHASKHPTLPGDVPFLIITPDERFPQGSTIEEQQDNRGKYILYVGGEGHARAERGTWRWSRYRDDRYRGHYPPVPGATDNMDLLTVEHVQLIKAEALYRQGDLAGAAAIVNNTRVENGGLNPTDANGTNTDCVPKLPNGSCGNLLEMLKWEYRLESYQQGLSPWFFTARRWGDHMQGTFLQLPVPGKELEVLQRGIYSFGGGEPSSAPVGTYGF